MANQYGKTWWGLQWLNSLNNIDYSNRLPRGRSYANNGAVAKIEITENRIKAWVNGSQRKPYQVDIILPPFFDPQLDKFIKALANRPVIISKLLNKELDQEVLSIAENMGLKVFPKQWTDFKMQCSCPDWAVPCKHLAAVIYKVSAEIDNNPFLVFSLHSVDLITEMNKLGLFINQETSRIPQLTNLYFNSAKNATKKVFNNEDAYIKPSFAQLKPIHVPLAALLSDFPAFYPNSDNFKEKYTTSINRNVKNCQRILQNKISLEAALNRSLKANKIGAHSKQTIILDEKFETKVLVDDIKNSLSDFLLQIVQIPNNKTLDYQPSTAALHTLFYASLHLLANGAIVPQIIQHSNANFSIRWLPAMLSKDVRNLIKELELILPPGIFVWEEKGTQKEIDNQPVLNLLSLFITELLHLFQERFSGALFLNLFFKNDQYAFTGPGEEALSGGIAAWLQKYFITQGKYKPQIEVTESLNDNFLISVNVLEKDTPQNAPLTLREILNVKKYDKNRFEILSAITQLNSFINGLDDYINSKGEQQILMNMESFAPFLFQMIPAIQLLDIDILLPKSLQHILKPKASIKVKAKTSKSFLRLDQLLEFDWQVAIGDHLMNEEDFKKLLKKSDGLIKYKSQYIYVNKEELEKLHKHFSGDVKLSSLQLLQTALSQEYHGSAISLTDEVRDLIKEITEVKEIPLPKKLKAKLRPYQQRGFSWMYRNAKIGFGSVLADDMGLGKTLQVITALLKYKEENATGDKKALVIAPTGLLTNWQVEINKFAPTLKTHLFHGSNRKITKDYDILLTSYGIARTEASNLKKLTWHSLVIDEAQNIKNQETAQAKAIKTIPADNFIAMSGTPVENRLSEIWSIMDYCNRGFLGSPKDFKENFANPIETYNDIKAADKLKMITSPFLMRRLKNDKKIISDLPDKIEMDCYSNLVKEQASLYEKTLEEALKEIEAIDASDKKGLFVRQGLVLQMILALKQICNHPTQFLKNNIMDAKLSGKLSLLFDKLDSIVESNEKVLVFTQFTEMGKILQFFIKERYGVSPLFYHGGNTLKQRKEMVNNFQTNHADKIFILSLKAAGTGLNLTAANHVIHYDLWWNPAVEAQATDRAYRIGQKNNVMVHRLITKNTFEERINEMIQSKKALAEMTVATGENWIGNLSNKELKQLFELGQ
ncbi:MAG TPA: DEAD/DEAH box helicase [Arachidicoccus soli]|nr:DEAD/DEAH box helicase [Arachidicoccus soli]